MSINGPISIKLYNIYTHLYYDCTALHHNTVIEKRWTFIFTTSKTSCKSRVHGKAAHNSLGETVSKINVTFINKWKIVFIDKWKILFDYWRWVKNTKLELLKLSHLWHPCINLSRGVNESILMFIFKTNKYSLFNQF